MFRGAESFNQPLNHWNVSLVNKMNATFKNAQSFNQPLDRWEAVTTWKKGELTCAKAAQSCGMSLSNFRYHATKHA